ncbi:MAG: GAF domain-containing protein [Bradymonadaceae bacterium]
MSDHPPNSAATSRRDEPTETSTDGDDEPTRRPRTRQELPEWFERSDRRIAEAVEDLSTDELVHFVKDVRHLLGHEEAKFACMQEISSELGKSVQLDDLLVSIMDKITGLMDAERSSLFLIDEETGELWSKVSQGVVDQEIRLEKGEGIAGWVAETGKSINIRDAYRDDRFNPEFDSETGFTTESILCQPVRNSDGDIMGVVEVLNSRSGEFSAADENLLSAIANQAAVAIQNSRLYLEQLEANRELRDTKKRLEKKVAELDLLHEVEQELSRAMDLDTVVQSITEKTLDLIDARASALTLVEEDGHRLYVLVDRADAPDERDWEFTRTRRSDDGGISAKARRRGEPVVCGSGDCEPVPDSTSDSMGIGVENALAVPLFDEDECIGSLRVANRRATGEGGPGFTDDDVKILTLIAGQIAGVVAARRHREKQKKQERLATIGQALSGVLHDFKSPASIISGYVQLMVSADDQSTREEYAERIQQQFDHFNQMIRELLVYARGESKIVLKERQLADYVDEIEQLLEEELANQGVNLSVEVDGQGTVQFDVAKINRAVLNLARNAAEATPEGGEVALRVSREDDGWLSFEVSDDGDGIPEEIRDTLYESFVTEGKEHGTGLGLAIVKKVVDDLNGMIDFETERGEGTTFSLRIPQGRELMEGAGEVEEVAGEVDQGESYEYAKSESAVASTSSG